MKNLILCLLILLVFSCNSIKRDITPKLDYLVTKIDSTNNYYFIYAKGSDENFKIVSEKNNLYCTNKVAVGKKYNFKTESIFISKIKDGDTFRQLTNHINIKCITLNGSIICKEYENGIYDVFRSENLQGLCYIK